MLHPNTYLVILAASIGLFSSSLKALILSVLTGALGFAVYRLLLDFRNFRSMRDMSNDVRFAAMSAGLRDPRQLQHQFQEIPKLMLFVAHFVRSLVFAAITAAAVFGIRHLFS
jgi:hypothetical protein